VTSLGVVFISFTLEFPPMKFSFDGSISTEGVLVMAQFRIMTAGVRQKGKEREFVSD
jgi:hypothetical protein